MEILAEQEIEDADDALVLASCLRDTFSGKRPACRPA